MLMEFLIKSHIDKKMSVYSLLNHGCGKVFLKGNNAFVTCVWCSLRCKASKIFSYFLSNSSKLVKILVMYETTITSLWYHFLFLVDGMDSRPQRYPGNRIFSYMLMFSLFCDYQFEKLKLIIILILVLAEVTKLVNFSMLY